MIETPTKARFTYNGMSFIFIHSGWDDVVKVRGRDRNARRWLKAKGLPTEYDNYWKVCRYASNKFFN